MNKAVITIDEENAGERIDKVLAGTFSDYSRSAIQKLIDDGLVFVGGKKVKASFKPELDDSVYITFPDAKEPDIVAENIPLDIIYEDDDIIVVNKPKDMVVHPANGHYSGTLVNALMYHCKDSLSGINGILRPGIVHRIDKDTSGSLIACKNDFSHNFLAEQFKVHSIRREYEAIVVGYLPEKTGRIEGAIGRNPNDRMKMAINEKNGKPAITNYEVLEELKGYTHVRCRLETGRTHQIRVHMASLHHPLLGDELYGIENKHFKLQGQCLHARTLGIIHPRTKEYMEFEAPLPEYFEKLIRQLRVN